MARYKINPFTNLYERVDKDTYVSPPITASSTISLEQEYLLVDASAGDVTLTLPDITSDNLGQYYFIKRTDTSANVVTISPSGSDTIEGSSSYLLSNENDSVHLVATSGDWAIYAEASGVSIPSYTHEPTGFVQSNDDSYCTLGFDNGTKVFTVTHVLDYEVFCKGVRYLKTTNQTVDLSTLITANGHGTYFIYFDLDGTLTANATGFSFSNGTAHVAQVYWDNTNSKGFVLDERHGCVMDWATHNYLHHTRGGQYDTGLAITYPTNDGDDGSLNLTAGDIHDEDIEHNIDAHTTCATFYRLDSTNFTWDTADSSVYKTTAGNIAYDNAGTVTAVDLNKFVCYYVIATNSDGANNDVISIMGQAQHTLQSDAEEEQINDLTISELPNNEFVVLYKIIYQRQAGGTVRIETFDLRYLASEGIASFTANDHGLLAGLQDDDHTQYLLISGTRAMTGDLNMGANAITAVNHIQFELSPTHIHSEGSIHWDADDKTLNIDTEQTDVALQVGQEMFARVYNNSGSTILNGQAVYVSGAQGSRPTVALADADVPALAKKFLGLATHDIPNNSNGYITTIGLVRGLNTNAYTAGTILYVSSTAGGWTDTPPTSPSRKVRIGMVLNQSSTEGVICCRPLVFQDIADLADVSVSGMANGDVLVWNNASGYWENSTSLTTHIADSTIHFTEGSIDHGSISGLSDNDHPQYMLVSNIGFGASNYLQLSATPGTPDGTKFLRDDGTWQDAGTSDHGALGGLGDDDHTQYAILDNSRGLQTFLGAITITGAFTSPGIDDDATAVSLTIGNSSCVMGQANTIWTMYHRDTDQYVLISGGSGANNGPNLVLYGEAHASSPGDIKLRSDGTTVYLYDDSLGTHTFNGQIITSTGQINFPNTQNPSSDLNVLDDYQEVTSWTPTLGGSGGTSGQSYAIRAGSYIKIGRLVMGHAYIQFSNKGTITGNLQISGFPISSETGNNYGASVSITPFQQWSCSTGYTDIVGYISGGSGIISLQQYDSSGTNGNTTCTTSNVGNSTAIRVSFCFYATD